MKNPYTYSALANCDKQFFKSMDESFLNDYSDDGFNLLSLALNYGTNCIKMVMSVSNALPFLNLDGTTPLTLAVMDGNIEAVKLYISYGISADDEEEEDDSSIHRAIDNSLHDILGLLLKTPCKKILNKTNYLGMTPLMLAALRGNECAIDSLLKAGAGSTINFMNCLSGETALSIANSLGFERIAEKLKATVKHTS